MQHITRPASIRNGLDSHTCEDLGLELVGEQCMRMRNNLIAVDVHHLGWYIQSAVITEHGVTPELRTITSNQEC